MRRFGDRFIDDRIDAARHLPLPGEGKRGNVRVKMALEPASRKVRCARQRSGLFE